VAEGLQQSGGRSDGGEENGRDKPIAASGFDSDSGPEPASSATPVSSSSQQIESFTRTLDRAFDAVSGFAGGVANEGVLNSVQDPFLSVSANAPLQSRLRHGS